MWQSKPIGKYKKAYEAGREAKRQGKKLTDNPNLYGPDITMSSWWESGWNSEMGLQGERIKQKRD